MILADSSIWIDYFNGEQNIQTDLLDESLFDGEIVLLDIVLTEVLQGFRKEKDFKTAVKLLDPIPCYPSLSKELAILTAANHRKLRRKGVTVRKTIDVIIATWCIKNRVSLLENDRDYQQIDKVLPLDLIR